MERARDGGRGRSATTRTRRRVLESAGVGLLGTAAVAGTGTAAAAGRDRDAEPDRDAATDARLETRQEEPVSEQPLIDAHTHLIPAPTRGQEPLDADGLIAWMDGAGVDRAVVHALDSPESYPVTAPSWWVLEQVESHPERLLPFCTIDPRTLVYADDARALLERYVERGARGFGELKAGLPVDDSRLETLYELCADYGLPVFVHLDDVAMLDDVGLPRFEDVLASYPAVDFLAHAHAWWAHVSADVGAADLGRYPDGPIEPGGRVPELLERYDNVYGDLAAGSGWNALTRDPAYAQGFLEDHHERLVFGTDYLHPEQDVPQLTLFDRFDLSADAWANIRSRNLERILR